MWSWEEGSSWGTRESDRIEPWDTAHTGGDNARKSAFGYKRHFSVFSPALMK